MSAEVKGRIALVTTCGFSHTNQSVKRMLASGFPQYAIDEIEVARLVRRNPWLVATNVLDAALRYARPLTHGPAALRDCFLRTPRFFSLARGKLLRRLQARRYAFTFQTQSLVDASCPGTPHFVYTDHTLLANRVGAGLGLGCFYGSRWQNLERRIYHNATGVFTMSRPVAQSVIEDYGCDVSRVACVYAGGNAPIPMHDPRDVTRYEKKRILFVGVDWKRKGGPLLVEAFKRVRQTHPAATLTVVGCSPKVNVQGCTIVGKVPLREIPAYFADASIFCLPSSREPFGIVLAEALRSGLPVVATNTPAAQDLVRESQTGTLVCTGDRDGLAAALRDLLDHPAFCLSLATHGVALVRERYNWKTVGRRIAGHIEAALNEREPQRCCTPN